MKNKTAFSTVLMVLCVVLVQISSLPPGVWAAQPPWETVLPGEQVTSIALQDGGTWAGTADHGLFKVSANGDVTASYRAVDGLAADGVTAVLVDAGGHVWAATHHGLSEFDGRKWRTWTTAQGLPSDAVDALTLGKQGQIFAGTSEGVGVFSAGRWSPYGQVKTEQGKRPRQVVSLAISPRGELWSGSWYDELMRMDTQAGWVPVNFDDIDNPYRLAQALTFGPQGDLWLGTAGGAWVLRGDAWQSYRQKDGHLPSDWVQAVAVDPGGRVWLGTDSGLALFDGQQWAVHRRPSGLAGSDVRAVAIDPQGYAWVATDGGLSRANWKDGASLVTVPSTAAAGPPPTEPPLRQAWKATWPGESAVQSIVAADGAIYVLTAEGIVRALSAADGQPLWQTSGWLAPQAARCPYDPPQMKGVGSSGQAPAPGVSLAVDGDTVVAAICAGWKEYMMDQELLLLDRSTGKLRATWPVTAGRLMGVSNGMLIISDKAGIAGLSLQDLQEIWRIPSADEFNRPYLMSLSDDVAIIKTYDKDYRATVSAHSVIDGSKLWFMPVEQDWELQATSDGLAFAVARESGSEEARLLALDLRTGKPVWQADLGSFKALYPSSLKLTVEGDTLYAYSISIPGGMAAYQASTGLKEWAALPEVQAKSVRRLEDRVYVIASDDKGSRLYALAAEDGRVVWSGLPAPSLTPGPVLGDTLYLATSQAGTDGYDAVLLALQARP